ncbi:endolytic transglycosylase MltG [Modestobacter lapidis]|nr:endolytic transglycosylase MltG [Modestobacter lapidis]
MSAPAGRRPGRHSSPDTDAGMPRSAAELLAAWATDRDGATGDGTNGQGVVEATDAVPAPRTAELRTAEMRALPGMPPRSPATRADSDRPTDGRPAARPTGNRPAGARSAGGRSAISRPAPDRMSPAPWATVDAPPAPAGEPDRELERFADDETAPGIPSGARRPLLGGRRSSDAGAAIALATPEAGPAAPAWPSRSPFAAALAAIDARHSTDDEDDESATVARPPADDRDDDPRPGVFDVTGGLEVVVADDHADDRFDDHDDDHSGGGGGGGGRRGGGRRGGGGSPRGRRPLAIVLSLVVLLGLVGGIVVGGQALLRAINPAAEDYAGAGTGSVDIRINSGDSLRTIAGTLVESDVIASSGPFLDAAEANEAATGIQPGVYAMRSQMSGQSALDLLLDPATRMVTRVTVPEGLTVAETLQRLAEGTDTPIEELQAAAADTSRLGLPAWSNGQLEGFLYPLTYEFEPGTPAVEMLQEMVGAFNGTAAELRLEERAAALGRTPYEVLTVASMVQSETRLDAERADVAQVIYNRLSQGIPLGIDATLAYGLDKSGNELTTTDLQTDGPYNSRTRTGLPPTPISAPGEASLVAALQPSTGDLLYYVLQSEDGAHFFTDSYPEFQAARQRCADAGLGCGAG